MSAKWGNGTMSSANDLHVSAPEDLRFFRASAIIMAVLIVAAFTLHYLAGRSTLSARPLVHAHGLVFMAWVGIFTVQAWLGATSSIALHRLLGGLAVLWVPLMVIMGTWITVDMVQRGTAPFFFQPQLFLIANPLGVLVFAGLVAAAVRMRRQTDWHARLQVGAMAAILGPAFGRLLPSPLLIPWAFEVAALAGLAFPIAGIVRDMRRGLGLHSAWLWAIVAIAGWLVLAHVLTASSAGDAIYAWVTAGHVGAAVPGLAYPPPPPMP